MKNRKMHFCQIFGLSKWLTGRKNGSQKGITGQELVSPISLPDGNWAIKNDYRMVSYFESPQILTKMHFSIFHSELSELSPMPR